MNLYFFFIVGLILIGAHFFFKNFNKDYLSKGTTSNVKGIFILIVFFSHMISGIKVARASSFLMMDVRTWLGQLMVTLFLFYSGYGIYESIKKEKTKYVNSIPKNRCLKTTIHYGIAITCYLLLRYYLGTTYPIKTIVLSYFAWAAIGASNWYIFAIVFQYFITWICFKIFDKDNKKAIQLSWVLSIILTLWLAKYRPNYCYNTILCYNLGLTYSYYKDDIEKVIMSSNLKWSLSFIISLISVLVLKKYQSQGWIYFELLSFSFCFLVLIITMKIDLRSKILKWFGDNLFWVYIWQRLPAIYLTSIGYQIHPYRYFAICFIITVILSIISSYFVPKIDSMIFKVKKRA